MRWQIIECEVIWWNDTKEPVKFISDIGYAMDILSFSRQDELGIRIIHYTRIFTWERHHKFDITKVGKV